ncbi:MAG: hypothetical protein R2744_00455 [Bacteroidales bacterium]
MIFKIAGRRNIDNYALITINYIVATSLGFSLGGIPRINGFSGGWYIMALIIGILFIAIFLVMAVTTQKSGMAVSTIASKMSVAIPITFSIIMFSEEVSAQKIMAIILALAAVLFTVYRKSNGIRLSWQVIFLPLILFLGTGTIDSLVKYSQEVYVSSGDSIQFSSMLFLVSALSGIVVIAFRPASRKEALSKDVILTGLILGIINFGSLFGLINALESNIFDSSVLFGINNIGIVMLSVIIAVLFFREKLLLINKIGIILSILSILLLSFV